MEQLFTLHLEMLKRHTFSVKQQFTTLEKETASGENAPFLVRESQGPSSSI